MKTKIAKKRLRIFLYSMLCLKLVWEIHSGLLVQQSAIQISKLQYNLIRDYLKRRQ